MELKLGKYVCEQKELGVAILEVIDIVGNRFHYIYTVDYGMVGVINSAPIASWYYWLDQDWIKDYLGPRCHYRILGEDT